MPKLNLKFYKEDLQCNESITKQEESEILEYINKYDEADYEKIFETDKRVPIFVNLSNIRKNIVKWYPFKKDAKTLEIGADFGSITGELCDLCSDVTSVEFSKNKAEAICKRHSKKDNLEVICAKLKDIVFEQKYDYVIAFNVIEYAKRLGFENASEMLVYLKSLLKDDGLILLTFDNKFGVKYICGSDNFSHMTGNYQSGYKTFGKYEIEKILNEINCNEYKFYYPLPDNKLTNLIYSDDYIPNEDECKISYNIYYEENDIVIFNELYLMKQFIKNNEFKNVCNTYFIEIGKSYNENIFVGFNNMRKDEYKLMTRLTKEEAVKETISEKANNHLKSIEKNIENLSGRGFEIIDRIDEDKVRSKFLKLSTYDVVLVKILETKGKEAFLKAIEDLFVYIKNKFNNIQSEENVFKKYEIDVPKNVSDKMFFVKDGYLDLIFQNIFYDGRYIVFDQEWYEQNMPLEFMLYRSLYNLYFHNKFIEKIVSIKEVFAYFKISEFVNFFETLEKKLQTKYANSIVVDFYTHNYKKIKSIDEITFKNFEKIMDLEEVITKLENEKREIANILDREKNENLVLKDKINNILSSRSWRYTKVFRRE